MARDARLAADLQVACVLAHRRPLGLHAHQVRVRLIQPPIKPSDHQCIPFHAPGTIRPCSESYSRQVHRPDIHITDREQHPSTLLLAPMILYRSQPRRLCSEAMDLLSLWSSRPCHMEELPSVLCPVGCWRRSAATAPHRRRRRGSRVDPPTADLSPTTSLIPSAHRAGCLMSLLSSLSPHPVSDSSRTCGFPLPGHRSIARALSCGADALSPRSPGRLSKPVYLSTGDCVVPESP
ncbi:hypothetical protein OH77DRAFT_785096 [Trametes cingulata]|nr:hypothetical protein OH77DRAFT_785096 [Trametes cingulata]